MASNEEKLGKNQQDWIESQKLLRKTYSWLGEIGQPPSEELLEKLRECTVFEYNTSCFMEGACISQSFPNCRLKERG